MGHLIRLIDHYRDNHGQPSEASIGRAIGVSGKTINAWRNRGVRQLPEKETLRALAEFLNVPYQTVLLAAAADAGYIDADPAPTSPPPPPVKPRATGTEGSVAGGRT